jgi:ribose transport system substrate-binding protein
MSKDFRLIALAATLTVSALVLVGCSFGGAAESSADPSEGGAQKALDAAYAGVRADSSLVSVDFPEEVQNVAIISCSLAIPSCAASAQAVSDAVVLAGWWPMVIDGGDPAGTGQAIRTALAQAATVIVMIDANCKGLEVPFDEVALSGIPVIALGGDDDCTPQRLAAVTRWTPDNAVGMRQKLVGELQADYAFGKIGGEVNALVLTVAGDPTTTKIANSFAAKLTKLGAGKVAQTLELTAAEVADKTFTTKVIEAAKSSGVNAIIVPADEWLTTGGLAAAIARDAKTAKLIVVGYGGTATALDLIRSGRAGLTATVGQAFDWMGWGAVDAIVRVYAGAPTVVIGDAMQVIDADHNMPETGKYTGDFDYEAKYTGLWLRTQATATSTPQPTQATDANSDR